MRETFYENISAKKEIVIDLSTIPSIDTYKNIAATNPDQVKEAFNSLDKITSGEITLVLRCPGGVGIIPTFVFPDTGYFYVSFVYGFNKIEIASGTVLENQKDMYAFRCKITKSGSIQMWCKQIAFEE